MSFKKKKKNIFNTNHRVSPRQQKYLAFSIDLQISSSWWTISLSYWKIMTWREFQGNNSHQRTNADIIVQENDELEEERRIKTTMKTCLLLQ